MNPVKRLASMEKILVISVFVVASCGLAYELVAGALASYLLGDSIFQFSSIIGTYLCAMGVGSHLSRYVKERVAERFIEIELVVGIIGGFSACILFLSFSWGGHFRPLLYSLVFMVGMLVGLEIPLVMRMLNERKTDFPTMVSTVLTFDYLGGLAVSLLFPLVLAPKLGLMKSAMLFGLMNVAVAAVTLKFLLPEIPPQRRRRLKTRAAIATMALIAGFAFSDTLSDRAERGMYADQIIAAKSSAYQRVVVTRWNDDTRLHLNGNLQFSSRDEARYHEALVHPAMAALPHPKSVLILGGGDGMAAREALKYKSVENIVLVDLDSAVTSMFKENKDLATLNDGSLSSPRLSVVNEDAAKWLEKNTGSFDLVIADFPDPSNFSVGKLYSSSFYRLVKKSMAENGLLVVQSTSPYFARRSFWIIDATLSDAGFDTWPYHVTVPSFGEWGFVIAGKNFSMPKSVPVQTKFVTPAVMRSMFEFPPDMERLPSEPNRLDSQTLVRTFGEDWGRVSR